MKLLVRRFISAYRQYLLLILLLTISLSLLPLNSNRGFSNIQKIAFGTFALCTSAANSFIDIFISDAKLIEQKRINAELMLEVNRLRQYAIENQKLRKLIEYKDTVNYPLIHAVVISKIVNDVHGNFILNCGENDSVKTGMPVLNEKGLVGIISNVSNNFSVARTLKNANFKIAVKLQKSGSEGILTWDGEDLTIANFPTTSMVENGERIVTSEFSTILPPSIPVGFVEGTRISISGVFKEVLVKSFADIESIKDVFVMKVIRSEEVNGLELNLFK